MWMWILMPSISVVVRDVGKNENQRCYSTSISVRVFRVVGFWNGFGGAYGGKECEDVGWSWEIQQISNRRKTVKEDVSSISAQSQKKLINRKEGEYRRGKIYSERRREKNNEKWTKTTETDLTIKQTLELDFLFWQTAMERRRKSKGSSENKELIKA